MDTNSYLRIESGFDISKITGLIPQNIGEGFQFNLDGKIYTTMGSYTKDKKDEWKSKFVLFGVFVGTQYIITQHCIFM